MFSSSYLSVLQVICSLRALVWPATVASLRPLVEAVVRTSLEKGVHFEDTQEAAQAQGEGQGGGGGFFFAEDDEEENDLSGW